MASGVVGGGSGKTKILSITRRAGGRRDNHRDILISHFFYGWNVFVTNLLAAGVIFLRIWEVLEIRKISITGEKVLFVCFLWENGEFFFERILRWILRSPFAGQGKLQPWQSVSLPLSDAIHMTVVISHAAQGNQTSTGLNHKDYNRTQRRECAGDDACNFFQRVGWKKKCKYTVG